MTGRNDRNKADAQTENELTYPPGFCKLIYMSKERKPPTTLTKTLRSAINRAIDDGESFIGLERQTGVLRQSLMTFARGESVLRLDSADRLAAHFGLVLVSSEGKGK
jgi:hypothetical protein